jgi:hypothetical protein
MFGAINDFVLSNVTGGNAAFGISKIKAVCRVWGALAEGQLGPRPAFAAESELLAYSLFLRLGHDRWMSLIHPSSSPSDSSAHSMRSWLFDG